MTNTFKFGRKSYKPKPTYTHYPNYIKIYPGNRVHLNSMNGTYVVVYVNRFFAGITCKNWKTLKASGQRKKDTIVVHRSNIKCLHGNEKLY